MLASSPLFTLGCFVYLVPFFRETVGATLVADFSMNRTDYVLGNLETSFPEELGELRSIRDELKYPSRGVFLSMLRREYPIAMDLLYFEKEI